MDTQTPNPSSYDSTEVTPTPGHISSSHDPNPTQSNTAPASVENSPRYSLRHKASATDTGESLIPEHKLCMEPSTIGSAPLPVPPLLTSPEKKASKDKRIPHSLPFLNNSRILRIIAEQETRAKNRAILQEDKQPVKVASSEPSLVQKNNSQSWRPEEVINFFRGVYVYGWGDWKKVCKMIKSRNNQQTKTHAQKLEKRFPELRTFFSDTQVIKMHDKYNVSVKRYPGANKVKGGSLSVASALLDKRGNRENEDAEIMAASVIKSLSQQVVPASPQKRIISKSSSPNKPKVTICFGDYVVDPENECYFDSFSPKRKRPAEDFDTSPPSPPRANCKQLFIPGTRVYARWLDKDDPVSYGTWYPGLIKASKVAPEDECSNLEIPQLLYDVKFDDGGESFDMKAEDVMMQEQYQIWLKDLEEYYSLPVTKKIRSTRIMKGKQVFAMWVDETDPTMHGSWLPGTVVSSKAINDEESNQLSRVYHVQFDNGDRDEELKDEFVLEKPIYKILYAEKINKRKKTPIISGLDLISAASRMTSPIKPSQSHYYDALTEETSEEIPGESCGSSVESSIGSDLHCHEVLSSRTPSPTNHPSRISHSPSPELHYGCYWVTKTRRKPPSSQMDHHTSGPFQSLEVKGLSPTATPLFQTSPSDSERCMAAVKDNVPQNAQDTKMENRDNSITVKTQNDIAITSPPSQEFYDCKSHTVNPVSDKQLSSMPSINSTELNSLTANKVGDSKSDLPITNLPRSDIADNTDKKSTLMDVIESSLARTDNTAESLSSR